MKPVWRRTVNFTLASYVVKCSFCALGYDSVLHFGQSCHERKEKVFHGGLGRNGFVDTMECDARFFRLPGSLLCIGGTAKHLAQLENRNGLYRSVRASSKRCCMPGRLMFSPMRRHPPQSRQAQGPSVLRRLVFKQFDERGCHHLCSDTRWTLWDI